MIPSLNLSSTLMFHYGFYEIPPPSYFEIHFYTMGILYSVRDSYDLADFYIKKFAFCYRDCFGPEYFEEYVRTEDIMYKIEVGPLKYHTDNGNINCVNEINKIIKNMPRNRELNINVFDNYENIIYDIYRFINNKCALIYDYPFDIDKLLNSEKNIHNLSRYGPFIEDFKSLDITIAKSKDHSLPLIPPISKIFLALYDIPLDPNIYEKTMGCILQGYRYQKIHIMFLYKRFFMYLYAASTSYSVKQYMIQRRK
jgi:hypothetical protein